MADSLDTNPVVIDLSNAADRIISTVPLFIKTVLISGTVSLGPTNIILHRGQSITNRALFRFADGSLSGNYQEDFEVKTRAVGGVFFENQTNRAWAANSYMLLYKE